MKQLFLASILLLFLGLSACATVTQDAPNLTTAAIGSFSGDPSATLGESAAEFRFSYEGPVDHFRVDLSTTLDMSWDVYVAFGAGSTSPIVVLDPQARWDKYRCGATLYWRVTAVYGSGSVSSQIREAQVCPANPFSDLSSAFNTTQANFTFAYSGSSGPFTITTSTRPDMSGATTTLRTARSPLRVRNPASTITDYRCGVVLYWRVTDSTGVSSPIQEKAVCGFVGFQDLSATLTGEQAVFAFKYRGATDHFRVDLSTTPDMSSDVYVFFGTGQVSPIMVADPEKWDKYQCGATLYYRVHEQLNGVSSEIRQATVQCVE